MDDDMATAVTEVTEATAEEKAIMNDINNHIDMCASNNSHYDIALVCYKCLKDKHRYGSNDSNDSNDSNNTNNAWEYSTTTAATTKWAPDFNSKQLIYSIRTIVCRAFTLRAMYWDDARDNEKYPDTAVIAVKLLQISSKLKDNKYISVLIKECKQFFMI